MSSEVSASNKVAPGIKIPELLAPAGSFEKMVAAIHYGADAVYCGGKKYSLRAHASNFSDRQLAEAVAYAHERDVKLYVTVNIFAHREDLQGLEKYLLFLKDIQADGIIISDPGILSLAKEIIPEIPVHLSTQANVTNPANAKFWEAQGVARLNVARELSLAEIAEIRQVLHETTLVEVFVHGALCISYSGRCLLSYYFTGRDANRGECAHPCRYKYVLQEEKRPDQYFPVEEDERGTYIFNSKDLCLLSKLPQLIGYGVDSLKIEGRMKSVYYVGAVVRIYRAAIDYIAQNIEEALADNRMISLPPVYMEELMKVGTRGYTENFIFGPPGAEDMLYDRSRTDQEYVPVGLVQGFGDRSQNDNWLQVEMRNPLRKGETIEYLCRDINAVSFEVLELLDQHGVPLEQANPGNTVTIHYDPAIDAAWEVNGLLRKKQ
ncbi:MAG: U32 family peptidase [Thermodesulfobacteriota bacterium]